MLAEPSHAARNASESGRMRSDDRTNRVLIAELEEQPEGLVEVERVVVEHLDIEVPLVEGFGRYERYARGQFLFYLCVGKNHVNFSVHLTYRMRPRWPREEKRGGGGAVTGTGERAGGASCPDVP